MAVAEILVLSGTSIRQLSADLAGVVVGELGRSAVVGVPVEGGVSAVVRGGRVCPVAVSLGDSVPLGSGRPARLGLLRLGLVLPP
jgi:hypothetical protein